MLNYRKQMGALVTGQMLSLLLGFVLPLILVRILDKNDYGLYAQLNVLLSFCTTFFSFGFSSELYYSYPIASDKEKRILVFQSFLLLIIAGIIAFIVLHIPIVKEYITNDGQLLDLYEYLSIAVLFSVPDVIITALYVLKHDHRTSAAFLPLMALIRVVLILGCYWMNPVVESIFIAVLMSILIKFIYISFYTFKMIGIREHSRLIDKAIFKKQLNYTIPLGIASSTRILVQQLDKLIILSFVSPAVYAVYSIAFYGVPGLTQVYLSISQVYIPRMSAAYKNSDIPALLNLYHSMVSKTLCYTIPIILIIALFADPIIPYVFSAKYTESIPYFQIYLFTFIIQSIGCGNILRATGETKLSLRAYLYTAIVMIPLTYVLIKYFYLNGAIISATIGAVLPKFLLSVYDAKSIDINMLKLYPWKKIATITIVSVLALIPFIGIYYLYGHDNFWLSLVWILIYLSVTFLIQMRYKVFLISFQEFRVYINKYIFKK